MGIDKALLDENPGGTWRYVMEFRQEPFDPVTEFDDALLYVAKLQEEYPVPIMTLEDVEKYKVSIGPIRIINST